MKILVYSDVHGNKYALENLYKTEDYKNADLKIFLGDVGSFCPYVNECFEMIIKSKDIMLAGNHDMYIGQGLPKDEYKYMSQGKIDHINYMTQKARQEYRNILKILPKYHFIEIFGKKFYFTHYAWETDFLVEDDPDDPMAPTINCGKLFDKVDADYIIFGHNHKPSDFQYNNKNFICVGTIGMHNPGYYLVIDISTNDVKIKRKTMDFNIKKLQNEIIKENYPLAETMAKWIEEK